MRNKLLKTITALTLATITALTPVYFEPVLINAATIKTSINTNSNIKISRTKASVYVGNKTELTLKGAESGVRWKSSNKSVATVYRGTVTAKKVGKVTITATHRGKSYTCQVTVEKPYMKGYREAYVDCKTKLTVYGRPSKEITWEISDSEKASITKYGTIIGKQLGRVKVTATYKDEVYEGYVIIKKPYINKTKLSMTNNKKQKLEVRGATTDVTWKSSNRRIATIDNNGVITGKSSGKVKITATCDGIKYYCNVTVKASKINVKTMYIWVNQEAYHQKTIPSENLDKATKWSSSNTKVVKVNNKGTLTSVGAGTATITAKTKAGKSYTCKVIVSKDRWEQEKRVYKMLKKQFNPKTKICKIRSDDFYYALGYVRPKLKKGEVCRSWINPYRKQPLDDAVAVEVLGELLYYRDNKINNAVFGETSIQYALNVFNDCKKEMYERGSFELADESEVPAKDLMPTKDEPYQIDALCQKIATANALAMSRQRELKHGADKRYVMDCTKWLYTESIGTWTGADYAGAFNLEGFAVGQFYHVGYGFSTQKDLTMGISMVYNARNGKIYFSAVSHPMDVSNLH